MFPLVQCTRVSSTDMASLADCGAFPWKLLEKEASDAIIIRMT